VRIPQEWARLKSDRQLARFANSTTGSLTSNECADAALEAGARALYRSLLSEHEPDIDSAMLRASTAAIGCFRKEAVVTARRGARVVVTILIGVVVATLVIVVPLLRTRRCVLVMLSGTAVVMVVGGIVVAVLVRTVLRLQS
jgi:hypothetical protein